MSAPRVLMPTWRFLAASLAVAVLAVGAYAVARETSIFAVRELEISGGTPAVQAKVRTALEPELGRSLVEIDRGELEARLRAIPDVLAVRFDRAFPSTLRVIVTPERPVLLLRRGDKGWVVSSSGRVIRPVQEARRSSLPRAWVSKEAEIEVGRRLAPEGGRMAAAIVAPIAGSGFPAKVKTVRADESELTLVLDGAPEIRFGDNNDFRLKLAVARRILLQLGSESPATYIDVSVPERPVAGTATLNSQVEVDSEEP